MRLEYGHKAASWPTRRTQRCLSFALIFTIIIIVGIYEHQSWPRKTELQLQMNTRRGFHIYGSSPDAGSPSLPFVESNVRKSSGEPLFEVPYDE
ncbi:hypothetical protein ONS95_001658 [Cadophora gregata]|uniref:uncharacterized protein n=1 Tax=Cadophora gregata TaxID=51156 RepID=UPI0026DB3444|nr:uncharacterized protein ONS95_001658 [Cadophora gregata]KAK0111287.1 hypothetical protein ONS95_001658 [Cadophora gregata]KAK0112241.1 hypothetical protein ONS96_001490 [Cadophora gregata f. sp. sojae]